MRVILLANAPWAGTGYAEQAHLIGKSLRNLGHQVAYCGFWGLTGNMIEWDGFPIYPRGYTDWGTDIIHMHAHHFRADMFISLMDVWPLPHDLGSRGFPWVAITPIDSAPVAPAIQAVLKSTVFQTVSYSRFGFDELKKVGLDSTYIPHGYDPESYYPDPRPQGENKEWLGFPADCFLVGMVAANKGFPSRKCFEEAFDAFAQFAAREPRARMFIHTMSGSQMTGPNLDDMALAYGIADKIRFANPYWTLVALDKADMRRVYSAFDVLLSPSLGEGFGVPVLESQACGTPVIVNDFSAQSELCGAGWAVKPSRRRWVPLNTFMAEPSIPGIRDALLESVHAAAGLRTQAHQFAQRYAQPRLEQLYWKPFMEEMERRILGAAAGAVREARGEPLAVAVGPEMKPVVTAALSDVVADELEPEPLVAEVTKLRRLRAVPKREPVEA